MPKFFISYSHNDIDRSRVETLVHELQQKGVLEAGEAFTDVSLRSTRGATLKGEIRTAIASASKVILLWTDAGSKSHWVNYEAGMADALGKPIVVVIPEGSPAEVPQNLKDAQVVRIKQDG